jgi:hypothetical protein
VKYELRFYIPEDGILHSHCRENLKSYIALTGWTLYWRGNVSPVKYELRFYIPEDDILHSHRRETLKSYNYSTIAHYKVLSYQTRRIMIQRQIRSFPMSARMRCCQFLALRPKLESSEFGGNELLQQVHAISCKNEPSARTSAAR